MRFAFISDIHGNLEALEAVFEDIEGQHVDEIVCLGDIVGYGANPNECAELVRQKCAYILLGNHDAAAVNLLATHHFNSHAKIAIEWTAANLKNEVRSFLLSLPLVLTRETLTLVHSTPYEPNMWYYITSLEEAAFNFQYFDSQICLVGHTHIPIIIVLDDKKEVYVHQASQITIGGLDGSRFLINVGSVGQPRDRNPDSCYAVFDAAVQEFTYRRVPYAIDKAQEKMKKIKMPEFLVNRLSEGR
ncbi:MAG: metallophosphoesterase family protein [Chitinispirillaceae bacterium]|nr:metallophosphoesterase family protein [Chitinispirillaceae bacterium]